MVTSIVLPLSVQKSIFNDFYKIVSFLLFLSRNKIPNFKYYLKYENCVCYFIRGKIGEVCGYFPQVIFVFGWWQYELLLLFSRFSALFVCLVIPIAPWLFLSL